MMSKVRYDLSDAQKSTTAKLKCAKNATKAEAAMLLPLRRPLTVVVTFCALQTDLVPTIAEKKRPRRETVARISENWLGY
jgi:hypothetical protein